MNDNNHVVISEENSETLAAGDLSTMSTGRLGPIPPITLSSKVLNGPQTNLANPVVSSNTQIKSTAKEGVREKDENDGLNLSMWKLTEIAIAEVIGTGFLMFFGCMGLIGTDLPKLQGPVVFGLTVATIIQIIGHVSAAHLNPAVTVTAVILGKISLTTSVIYFISEIIGAILGFSLLKIVTPCDLWTMSTHNVTGFCTTVPIESLSDSQALALEFLATMLLVFLICGVWDARNADKPDSVPLKFAAIITLLSIIVGPLTGASMNPARSLAPAIVNGVWTKHWIYWVGPLSAAFLTTCFYQIVFDRKQQSQTEVAEELPLTNVTISKPNTRNIRHPNATSDIKHTGEHQ